MLYLFYKDDLSTRWVFFYFRIGKVNMLHQLSRQATQPSSQNTSQLGGNKQSTFLEHIRVSIQRPTLSEKCRDLTKLIICAIPTQRHDQG